MTEQEKKMFNLSKITRLTKYADNLKQRLLSPIPERHRHAPASFKQMLEIDLQKTLSDIEKLKG